MADRVVKVTLSAQVAEYQKGMLEAARVTRTAGTEAEKLTQKKQEFELLGRGMLVAGGVMAAGVGLAVGKFMEFDQAMSNVIATGEDATDNQVALREAALEAGAATVFSATESANAIEEMAKAGLNATDILGGGLTGALDLAAAGGLGVARSAEVMSTTLQQFKLDGTDASHVADLLAAGAGKAMGDVEDMAQALNQAGLVANQFQVPVEETVGTLSAFASAGMLGSDAGTSLRTMLLRLANPTKENAQLMDALGINAYDASGKFIGMAGLAGELETAFAGMTEEQKQSNLAMIFGQDAIRGATILLNEGKTGIQEYTRMVDDQGYAAETAAKRLDNLKGDIEGLSGAVETGLIQMGESANGPGRFIVQLLTTMVDGFNALPDAGQAAVFWTGAVGAAVAIAGGIFLTTVPKVAEYNAAIEGMGPKAQRASRMVGVAMKGLGVGTAVIASWTILSSAVDMAEESIFKISDNARNLTADNASLADSFDQLVNSGVSWNDVAKNQNDVLDRLGDLGNVFVYIGALDETGRAAVGLSTALKGLSPALTALPLEDAQRQFAGYVEELGATDEQVLSLLNNMPEFKESLLATAKAQELSQDDATLLALALGRIKPATDSATEGTTENAAALAELQGAAQDTEGAVDKLANAISTFGEANLDTRAAARDFQQSLDDLKKSVKDNGTSLDITTQKGRDNEAAIDAAAQSALDYAAATAIRTGSEEEAAKVLEQGRDRLLDMLEMFGITGDEAEAYADQLGLIPDNIQTFVEATVDPAQGAINRFIELNSGRKIPLRITASGISSITLPNGMTATSSANGNLFEYGQAMQRAFASGGGVDTGIYAGRPQAIHKFAEQETVWEAFISGKPDQRERNIGIWQDTGRRLGVEQGGSMTKVDAPITVHALPGMDTNQVADAAVRKLQFKLRSS